MTFWVIFQVVLNIGLIALGLVVWARVSRPQKDDPRLSRGLQLLQSKIAILEDLSDRTDIQVKQLTQLLDQKAKDMDLKISSAESQLLKVDQSIQKSLEVSKIFQDKIPHKEIIERQNTLKYIQAARLAHQGMTPQEIAQKVDIPMGELEFIAKVNKNKLMFSEEHLPEWAQESLDLFENPSAPEPVMQPSLARSLSMSFENNNHVDVNSQAIQKIEQEFKKAVIENTQNVSGLNEVTPNLEQPQKAAPQSAPVIPFHAPEIGELEIGLEGDLTAADLKSSIQKAKELLNRTMDKTFETTTEATSAAHTGTPGMKRSSVIREDDSKKIKPYAFKKIEL